jgi:hypothetical protein
MTTRELTRIRHGDGLYWRLEFKPQDCWIGASWKTREAGMGPVIHLWLCLLPMLPIHVMYEVR